jgi:hypothetical protein
MTASTGIPQAVPALGDAVSLRFTMRPDELEKQLQERLESLGPAPRAELLHVLMLPDAPHLRATDFL